MWISKAAFTWWQHLKAGGDLKTVPLSASKKAAASAAQVALAAKDDASAGVSTNSGADGVDLTRDGNAHGACRLTEELRGRAGTLNGDLLCEHGEKTA